jgi:hypothetical protein
MSHCITLDSFDFGFRYRQLCFHERLHILVKLGGVPRLGHDDGNKEWKTREKKTVTVL